MRRRANSMEDRGLPEEEFLRASSPERSTGGNESPVDEPYDVGTVPFEELEAVKQDGTTTKRALMPLLKRASGASKARDYKRDNKNRPMEMSSKRPVPRLREVVQVTKNASRDPRFDDLSGNLSPDRFRKQYAFLYDEQLPAERDQLKATLQRTKGEDKKRQVQAQLTRVQQQIREEESRRRKQVWEAGQKSKEKEAVQAGKGLFFPKRSEKKRQQLIARYQELKETGRLEKVMAKRRIKNAAKDHRYVPAERRQADA